ncbi:ExbD/TolR family protein [Longimicrobium terrae]|uniref:Biopolymer transport protein ExbD n=1 Tax=Longimicrobium terrae TaxID=1639882 RepID=A0A841GY28_9BACT|nr:biopolymer transporter ExbD [Longimicrobium terrae]MBB4636270.1 biopolymer transport protein ExbD [Longimicrobium terrae]MBB6070665.1 biopolymer transport protein ExbD [Longimicrobium terrae]NNC29648.1 biopolymer transporter ExbD [Longimicrobium terrae]
MHRDPIAGFRDPLARIDLTPFIGVALVLLLVSMVITPGNGPYHYTPKARTSAEMRRGMVTVYLGPYDLAYVEGAPSAGPVRRTEIAHWMGVALRALPEDRRGTVYLDAHYNAPYADVLSVLSAASDNGVRRVGLITVPPRD